MALLFGASLPAADGLGLLLEGYGLMVGDSPDVDEQLREIDLPALGAADGDLGAAMALSFVRYLVERGGKETFLRMLASAQPGRLDAAAQQEYGTGMAALDEAWRQKLAAGAPDMKTGQFLRLTMRYLRPHRRREIEMFIYMLLGLAFTVVFPFVFKNLLDHAIPSGQFSQVLQLLGLLSIAFVITALAGLRGAYLSAVVSGSVVRQLRQEMFTKMQHLSQGWYNRHQQGDVLSRVFSDVGMLEQGLSQTLRGGLVQILTLGVSATVLIILNFWLALIVLLGAPVIALIYKAMSKGAQKRSIAVQEETGGVLTVASENYGAQSVVKAFGLQAREVGALPPVERPPVRPPGRAPALRRAVRGVGADGRHGPAGVHPGLRLVAHLPRAPDHRWAGGLHEPHGPDPGAGDRAHRHRPADPVVDRRAGAHQRGARGRARGGRATRRRPSWRRCCTPSACATSGSPTPPSASRSTTSTSRSPPASASPSWGRPAPASPRSCSCSCASTTPTRARCSSTASTSARPPWRRCGRSSAWCSRRRSCSTRPSARTSDSATPTPPTPRSKRRPAPPSCTTSWSTCPAATRRSWASGAGASRAASANGCRSPGRCCATPASCCSTRPPRRSTPAPSG